MTSKPNRFEHREDGVNRQTANETLDISTREGFSIFAFFSSFNPNAVKRFRKMVSNAIDTRREDLSYWHSILKDLNLGMSRGNEFTELSETELLVEELGERHRKRSIKRRRGKAGAPKGARSMTKEDAKACCRFTAMPYVGAVAAGASVFKTRNFINRGFSRSVGFGGKRPKTRSKTPPNNGHPLVYVGELWQLEKWSDLSQKMFGDEINEIPVGSSSA